MQFTRLLFPAPLSSYNAFDPDLIWIPKRKPSLFKKVLGKKEELFPAFFIPYVKPGREQGSSQILLFFHANGEDIGISYEVLISLQQNLNINVLAVEYPGYGVYKGKPSEKQVLNDAEDALKFVVTQLGFKLGDVFVMGRSIGTGPASHLGGMNPELGGVFLVSPFSSIKAVARSLLGNQLPFLLRNQFNNLKAAKNIKAPVFVVHGCLDTLIPLEQSQAILSFCGSPITGYKFPPQMTHNRFNLLHDIITPIKTFCKINGIPLGKLGRVVTIEPRHYNQKLAGPTADLLEQQLASRNSLSLTAISDRKSSQFSVASDKLNETCS